MKLPRRTCQGAAKKEPHRPRSCPGGTVKESQGVAQDELPRPPPGAGSCRCPSATGAPLCSTRTQVRTCHCHMEGRPRPSNLSPWSSWCTCHKWKAAGAAASALQGPAPPNLPTPRSIMVHLQTQGDPSAGGECQGAGGEPRGEDPKPRHYQGRPRGEDPRHHLHQEDPKLGEAEAAATTIKGEATEAQGETCGKQTCKP